ncbi:MAG: galactokinase family protein [Lachnospiraceae bacterium]|nr:galactokinase family protein [Lachnospiraceae bacterium]
MDLKCEEKFYAIYHRMPDGVTFCPYRISPLGAHIDHQWGKINGLAIDRGIHIAYGAKQNGVIEMESLDFPKRAQFHVRSIEPERVGDWADYLRGAALGLSELYPLRTGLSGVIEGSLPIGGLSSSAAVTISFLSALCRVNGITLEPQEMIRLARAAENNYVGVQTGILDQSCEILGRKDHLLYMDCRDGSFRLIPTNPKMKPYKIAIIFSGLDRALKNSAYNLRVDECRAAAYDLLAFAGLPYDKLNQTHLRDVPVEVYETYKERLPAQFRKRAEHFFTEYKRAEEGAYAWERGDLDAYGRLVFESGYSSIHNYECGCPELIRLYEILLETEGVYGARFSGAGFKGCCMALIDPLRAEEIGARVRDLYLKDFPALADKYEFHVCESADGAQL